MQRWRGYTAAPGGWGRSVVTIGVFDGVHVGHQQTIRHAVQRARQLGLASLLLTFTPHPSEVVRPGSHPAVLTSPERKAELVAELGVDVLCAQPFTVEFSRLDAEQFVHDVLVEHLHAAVVVVGENFRFGHRAAGDTALLNTLGQRFGFTVESTPLVGGRTSSTHVVVGGRTSPTHIAGVGDSAAGIIYSSTYVRSCVDAGEVTTAAEVLGRPHRVEGVVVRGDQRGREIGFPTANLLTAQYTAVPADGVYACWLSGGHLGAGRRLAAAVSIGTNPTFSGQERRVEAYVLDFEGDLYGERVALDFVEHLRPMLKFDGVPELITAINDDVVRTRKILGVAW